MWELTALPQAP